MEGGLYVSVFRGVGGRVNISTPPPFRLKNYLAGLCNGVSIEL